MQSIRNLQYKLWYKLISLYMHKQNPYLKANSKNEKKDNKQCLSDNPRWSMRKTNIKNTKAIQNG